jgi:hypothetical protein
MLSLSYPAVLSCSLLVTLVVFFLSYSSRHPLLTVPRGDPLLAFLPRSCCHVDGIAVPCAQGCAKWTRLLPCHRAASRRRAASRHRAALLPRGCRPITGAVLSCPVLIILSGCIVLFWLLYPGLHVLAVLCVTVVLFVVGILLSCAGCDNC